ncbi:RHS repeat domain-containing protein [Luteibacter sp. CQ10]|uniref:RHS repeat domain-containing protein n=1 Tax=Luteibacter sp. CQ10 TaxID=2805821 RepID=UPI0034A2B83A
MAPSLWSLPRVSPATGDLERKYLLSPLCPWVSDSPLDAGIDDAFARSASAMDAYLIRDDGEIVERLAYAPGDDATWGKAGWQKALAAFVQTNGVQLKAGVAGKKGLVLEDTGNRLWHYGHDCRSFSTLPSPDNWVRALCLEPVEVPAGTSLWIEVRDIRTQRLYERIRFTAPDAGGWIPGLCEEINRASRWIRAGQGWKAESEDMPGIFIPQHSDLAVTLSTFADETQVVEAAPSVRATSGPTLPDSLETIDPFWASDFLQSHLDRRAGIEGEASTSETQLTLRKAQAFWNAYRVWLARQPFLTSATKADVRPMQWNVISEENSFLASLAPREYKGEFVFPYRSRPLSFEMPKIPLDPALDEICWEFQIDRKTALHLNANDLMFLLRLDGSVDVMSLRAQHLREEAHLPGPWSRDGNPRQVQPGLVQPWNDCRFYYADRSMSWEGQGPCLRLQPTSGGSWEPGWYRVYMHIAGSYAPETASTLLGEAGFCSRTAPWASISSLSIPLRALRSTQTAYEPTSLLCEDYGNTAGSELFDTEGETETGVNPQTGLFHAHYPVATLHALNGRDGQLDLTLHYSARRGNEAGLGDGWAFRFSGFEYRDRRLTLDSGEVIRFTDDEWDELLEGKTVRRAPCWVSADTDGDDLSGIGRLIVTHPSGRIDTLVRPSGDRTESNQAFVDQWKARIQTAKSKLSEPEKKEVDALMAQYQSNWFDVLVPFAGPIKAVVSKGIETYVEQRREREKANSPLIKELERLRDYLDRPFGYFLSSTIVMPQGGRFDLTWQQRSGQCLLKRIESGATCLFTADYPVIADLLARSTVTMSCFPGTGSEMSVGLTLERLLLVQASRRDGEVIDNDTASYRVTRFEYHHVETLDHVLVSVTDPDGSIEQVIYQSNVMAYPDATPSLPAVRIHSVRDRGSLARLARYAYSPNHYLTRSGHFSTTIDRGDAGSTYLEFDKHHRRVKEVQTSGEAKQTTEWSYEEDASPKRLAYSQVKSITTTYEDGDEDGDEDAYEYEKAKETVVQSFTYDNAGRLTQSTAADGTLTQWWYYPREGGNASDGIAEDSVGRDSLAELTCPAYPAVQNASLLSCAYEYRHLDDGTLQPHALKFYGYTLNAAGRLESRRHVELRGVIRDGKVLRLAAGRQSPVIQIVQTILTDPVTEAGQSTWSESSQTTILWNGMRSQTRYTGTWREDATRRIKSVSMETDGRTVEQPEAETFCRFTRHLLSRRDGDKVLRWRWHGEGRQMVEGESWPTANRQLANVGGMACETEYDGLGHAIRRTVDGRLVYRAYYDHDALVCESRYDHLPGGLCRARHGSLAAPAFSQTRTRNPDAFGEDVDTETVSVLLGDRVVSTIAEQETVTASCGVVHRRTVYAPDATTLNTSIRHYDDRSRLTRIENGKEKRAITIEYDDLDRPVAHVMPDGTRLERSYLGLTRQVQRIDWVKSAKERIALGEQAQESGRLSRRKVGAYACEYPAADTVRYPDGRQVVQRVTGPIRETRQDSATGNLLVRRSVEDDGRTVRLTSGTANQVIDGMTLGRHEQVVEGRPRSWSLSLTQTTPLGSREGEIRMSLQGQPLAVTSLAGTRTRLFRDAYERVVRKIDEDADRRYIYGDTGLLERQEVFDGTRHLTMTVTHDPAGREIERAYVVDGDEQVRFGFTYQDNGQLASKTMSRAGSVQTTETYRYDPQTERLLTYACDAADPALAPTDETGKAFRSQAFAHDSLGNLLSCTTVYVDGTQRSLGYEYDKASPCLRRFVTVDGKKTELRYDARGNLLSDERGRCFEYNLLGQVVRVTDGKGTVLARYDYDGLMRLSAAYDGDSGYTRQLVYDDNRLIAETWLDKGLSPIQTVRFDGVMQSTVKDGRTTVDFAFVDPFSGTRGIAGGDMVTFGPFGDHCGSTPSSVGYNGQWRDPVLGGYHLGNGYRYYDPAARMFHQMDTLSPFGEGGINDRAYCDGDPINLHDPSGHVLLSRWAQQQQLSELDRLIDSLDPPDDPPEVDDRPWYVRAMSSIIWGGVAILASVAAVLLAIPTGGASLVFAGVILAATVVSTGIQLAAEAIRYSHPKIANALSWAGFAMDMAMAAPTIVSFTGRLLSWSASRIGKLASRVSERLRPPLGVGSRGGLRNMLEGGTKFLPMPNRAAWAPLNTASPKPVTKPWVEALGDLKFGSSRRSATSLPVETYASRGKLAVESTSPMGGRKLGSLLGENADTLDFTYNMTCLPLFFSSTLDRLEETAGNIVEAATPGDVIDAPSGFTVPTYLNVPEMQGAMS